MAQSAKIVPIHRKRPANEHIGRGEGGAWHADEMRVLRNLFDRLCSVRRVDHWAVGTTDSGYAQFYFINTENSESAYIVSRIDATYRLECGSGEFVGEWRDLRVLVDDNFSWARSL